MTSVFMVLEVSGNYSIVLPGDSGITRRCLPAFTQSSACSHLLRFFTRQRRPSELPSMEEQREEHELHIEDALRPVHVVVPIFRRQYAD